MTGMKQYLLSIYQPDGDPPPPEILEPIMKDIEARSEEHTSELQSRLHLVCRLLLEEKTEGISYWAGIFRRIDRQVRHCQYDNYQWRRGDIGAGWELRLGCDLFVQVVLTHVVRDNEI